MDVGTGKNRNRRRERYGRRDTLLERYGWEVDWSVERDIELV